MGCLLSELIEADFKKKGERRHPNILFSISPESGEGPDAIGIVWASRQVHESEDPWRAFEVPSRRRGAAMLCRAVTRAGQNTANASSRKCAFVKLNDP